MSEQTIEAFGRKKRGVKMETTFKCLDDCSECCGVVPIPMDTWNKFKHLARKPKVFNEDKAEGVVYAINDDFFCAFLKDNKCAIYENRPKICRDYGLIEGLPCPHIKPNGHKRSPAQAKRIIRQKRKELHNFMKRLKDRGDKGAWKEATQA